MEVASVGDVQEYSSVGDVQEYAGIGYALIRTFKSLVCVGQFKYEVYYVTYTG